MVVSMRLPLSYNFTAAGGYIYSGLFLLRLNCPGGIP